MPQPEAYLNGKFVPATQAVISVTDGGFVQGTTVAEQLRTFGGRLFRLEGHLQRLFHSLEIVEVEPHLSRDQLAEVAHELAARNHRLLEHGDDLGLAMFITPGPYGAMTGSGPPPQPTVCLHTFPLRFGLWAEKYERGESLVTTDVQQVSTHSWPPELKCRSRMHYYLADRQAARRSPGSRALMRDAQGFVTETATANIALYRKEQGLVLPPRAKVLPGISLAVLVELADTLSIGHHEQELTVDDVASADEAFVTSTSPCMLPVVRFNDRPIGSGAAGPAYVKLLTAWSKLVGVDIVAQARQFAGRP